MLKCRGWLPVVAKVIWVVARWFLSVWREKSPPSSLRCLNMSYSNSKSDVCGTNDVSSCFPDRGFETEEQFEEFVKNDPQSGKILAAIVFEHPFSHDDEPLPLQVRLSNQTDMCVNALAFLWAFNQSQSSCLPPPVSQDQPVQLHTECFESLRGWISWRNVLIFHFNVNK